MQNNIPTLHILYLDSSVVKSAKISTILRLFSGKKNKNNIDRVAIITEDRSYRGVTEH